VLGAVSCISESHAAIAISRGGAKKTYAHRDPNEDACGFAFSPAGTVLAVADGHAGSDAAQIAIEYAINQLAPRLLAADAAGPADHWRERAVELGLEVHQQILRSVETVAQYPPRTTLALAVVRPQENQLAWMSVGDSLIFRVDAEGIAALGCKPERVVYLGSPRDDHDRLSLGIYAGVTSLEGAQAIALATDGLSEEGIGVPDPLEAVRKAIDGAATAETLELRPLDAARGLAEIANQAHRDQKAGDNIATAVTWLLT